MAAVQCISETGGYCAKLARIGDTPRPQGFLSGLAQTTGVPGLEFLGLGTDASLGDILTSLYIFGLALVAVSALLVLTAAGVMYITAGDNEERFKEAKKWMGNAAFGLFLALISYLILFTINPDLTKVVDIAKILPKIGPTIPEDSTVPEDGTIPEGGTCYAGGPPCAPDLTCTDLGSGGVCQ